MSIFIGLIVVAFIIVYKRSNEIITVNPMRGASPAAPVLRGPEDEKDAPEAIDFSRILNTVMEAAQHQSGGGAKLPDRGRSAIIALVRDNRFIEAMQLYRRIYGVDLATAKKAVDKIMLEQ